MKQDEAWSADVAAITIDALVDAGFIRKADATRATAIAANEINIRLALHDFPPNRGAREKGGSATPQK